MSDEAIEAQAKQFTDRLFGQLDLQPLTCPACETRFGMTADDVRFAEQTGETVYCPRGHKLRLTMPTGGGGET